LVDHTEKCAFVFHRYIAVFIGSRSPNNRDIRRDGAVVEPFLALELDYFYQFALGKCIHPSSVTTRVDKCVETYFR
jgi:hypothetical protein